MKAFRFFLVVWISLAVTACSFPTKTTTIPCGDVTQLIAAINDANSNPGIHAEIHLADGCTYELVSITGIVNGRNGLPSIASHIVIHGHGATILRSEDNTTHNFRLFHVSESGDLTLNDLALTQGHADGDGSDSYLDEGGAILNLGRLAINDTLITHNQAEGFGGGILNVGSMTIRNSTINYNEGFLRGGILSYGEVSISQSTISDNVGDGIWNNGSLEIINSTISGNTGTGIDNDTGILKLEFVTIANNLGGILTTSHDVTFRNTIFGPHGGNTCALGNSPTTLGVNMDTDGTCFVTTVYPNSLRLGPLADNGGPTKTHALLPGSIAIDSASGECALTDQRGIHRPQGASCDIGAFEFDGDFAHPTAKPTIVPYLTEQVCMYTAIVIANCRSGPGSSIYPALDRFEPGQGSPVLGVSPDGFFYQVISPNSRVPCYVPAGEDLGQLTGRCDEIPVLTPPATPQPTTLPTPSATPPVIGCTVRQAGGAIICVHPCPAGASPGESCTMP